MQNLNQYDVIVIGGGAAGLMAAMQSGRRGRKTLLLEANENLGEKIRISGGGRCNFTNLNAGPNNYISQNCHFTKSALAQYDQHDFIKLIESHNIAYHEKTLGQLFCDISSKQIITMLEHECLKNNVVIITSARVIKVTKNIEFEVLIENGDKYLSTSLILATGGLSIPKLGANDFGYKVAQQFGHKIVDLNPALVPLIVKESDLDFFRGLSGISINSKVNSKQISFNENILFTHRGLSGPAILQISSYLDLPDKFKINFRPELDWKAIFRDHSHDKMLLSNLLKLYLPKRFVEALNYKKRIIDYSGKEINEIIAALEEFEVEIVNSEGYLKAEVTRGGVDTKDLSSKTMQSSLCKNLYIIGELVDVTGWLGGYNFQWAWSSGFVAGNNA
jgi:predicted Rossmann fold flavoprotein